MNCKGVTDKQHKQTENAALSYLIERLDLVIFPAEYLNKLEAGRRYSIDLIYRRLKALKVIDCDYFFFKRMLTVNENFTVIGSEVVKK